MSTSDLFRKQQEALEVRALRKRARGEPLTDEESAALLVATRTPIERGVSRAIVDAELQERRRRGE